MDCGSRATTFLFLTAVPLFLDSHSPWIQVVVVGNADFFQRNHLIDIQLRLPNGGIRFHDDLWLVIL